MNLPELGVGLNWFPELEPVVKENKELVDLLEVEPQSLWRREKDSERFGAGPRVAGSAASIPGPSAGA